MGSNKSHSTDNTGTWDNDNIVIPRRLSLLHKDANFEAFIFIFKLSIPFLPSSSLSSLAARFSQSQEGSGLLKKKKNSFLL